MINKILKVGDSAAVTLSKNTLDVLGVTFGDRVIINIQPRKRKITILPFEQNYQTRDYTKQEINEFLVADKLDKKTADFVKNLLAQE